MDLLAVATPLDGLHHQVLGGDEGQVLIYRAGDDLFIDADAVGDVLHQPQDGVAAQKALGQGDAAVGGIIQSALHPLDGGGHGGVHGIGHEIPGQGADALGAHGVALVGHGGGAHLLVLEGLFQLAVMLQQAHIVGEAVAALGDGGQHVENAAVELAGIGLAGHREDALKAELGGDHPVHLVDLALVSLKQVQEAGLGAGGAPAAQETHGIQHKIQLLQVQHQVLEPKGGTLAHGDQLGGLVMGVAQGGQVLVLPGEVRQVLHGVQQLAAEVTQAVPVEDQVGIVGDIAGGGAQMDDALRARGHQAVGVDVGHDIVADLLFLDPDGLVVNVGEVGLQFGHLGFRYRQAQLVLRTGQGHPQPPPGLVAGIGGEQLQHIIGGIAGGQGAFITVFTHISTLLSG